MSSLNDELNIEVDRRKLQRLVDTGVVTQDEIDAADIEVIE